MNVDGFNRLNLPDPVSLCFNLHARRWRIEHGNGKRSQSHKLHWEKKLNIDSKFDQQTLNWCAKY